jgi:alcohol dehydrogenase, propanol-preferring
MSTSIELPSTQTAATIQDPGANGHVVIGHDLPVSEPGSGEILVKLEYSGIWYGFVLALFH